MQDAVGEERGEDGSGVHADPEVGEADGEFGGGIEVAQIEDLAGNVSG